MARTCEIEGVRTVVYEALGGWTWYIPDARGRFVGKLVRTDAREFFPTREGALADCAAAWREYVAGRKGL